jgi:hypothetical protein
MIFMMLKSLEQQLGRTQLELHLNVAAAAPGDVGQVCSALTLERNAEQVAGRLFDLIVDLGGRTAKVIETGGQRVATCCADWRLVG